MDEGRPEALQFLAQVAHVRLYHVPVATEVVVPDVVENLRLGKHMTWIEQEITQEVELGRRQLNVVPAPPHLVRALVELEVGEAQYSVVFGLITGAPQYRRARAAMTSAKAKGLVT